MAGCLSHGMALAGPTLPTTEDPTGLLYKSVWTLKPCGDSAVAVRFQKEQTGISTLVFSSSISASGLCSRKHRLTLRKCQPLRGELEPREAGAGASPKVRMTQPSSEKPPATGEGGAVRKG